LRPREAVSPILTGTASYFAGPWLPFGRPPAVGAPRKRPSLSTAPPNSTWGSISAKRDRRPVDFSQAAGIVAHACRRPTSAHSPHALSLHYRIWASRVRSVTEKVAASGQPPVIAAIERSRGLGEPSRGPGTVSFDPIRFSFDLGRICLERIRVSRGLGRLSWGPGTVSFDLGRICLERIRRSRGPGRLSQGPGALSVGRTASSFEPGSALQA
jgi:hypothetical protein